MPAIINSGIVIGSRTATAGEDGRASYSVQKFYECDTYNISPVDMGLLIGMNTGDLYDGKIIKNLSLAEGTDQNMWILTITYGDNALTDPGTNPLDEPWDFQISFGQSEVPIDFDSAGRGILNTAGDPFAEFLMVQRSYPVLTATKNFAELPYDLINQYADTINRDQFRNAAPGTLKIERFTNGGKQTASYLGELITYYPITVEISYNRDGWKEVVLNTGFRQLVDGEKKDILVDGEKITTPVLLRKDGTKADDDEPAYKLVFDKYRNTSFGRLFI